MIPDTTCKPKTPDTVTWTADELSAYTARVWVLGDNIDTDLLAPGQHMKKGIVEMATHCLEAIDPDFAKNVMPGDIIVAGEGFGIGSSREQAAQVLLQLGIRAIVAKSFARIFYRNAINLGLPAIRADLQSIGNGEQIRIDFISGQIYQHKQSQMTKVAALPQPLLDIILDGGLMPHLSKKLNS